MNDCKVCQGHYGSHRTHCPFCGAFNLKFGSFVMKLDYMIRVIRARGAYSVSQNLKFGKSPVVLNSHPW